jgi:hypothetical protein
MNAVSSQGAEAAMLRWWNYHGVCGPVPPEVAPESQDTDDWYRARCTGAVFVTNPSDRRYVATTRKDGAMRISGAAR